MPQQDNDSTASVAKQVISGTILVPFNARALVMLCLAMLFTFLIILLSFTYAPGENVRGYLEPTKGLIKIKTPYAGQIDNIFVRIGNEVTRNTPLFSVVDNTLDEQNITYDSKISDIQEQKKQELKAQIEQLAKELAVEHRALVLQSNDLRGKIDHLDDRIVLQKKLIARVESRTQNLRKLSRSKIISKAELDESEIKLLRLRQDLLGLIEQKDKFTNELESKKIQKDKLVLDIKKRRAELEIRLHSLAENMSQNRSSNQKIISSLTSGTVERVNVVRGATVVPSERIIMEIKPKDSELLKAVLFIPSDRVGIAVPNQKVKIFFDAFPVEKFGTLDARLRFISSVAEKAEEGNIKLDDQFLYYRAEATISSQIISFDDKKFPLRAGLTLSADLIQQERTLLEWLFKPLFRVRERLLN